MEFFSHFARIIQALVGWFTDALQEAEMDGPFLAVFFMVLLNRFILRPIFGSAGSDKARITKED